ncbi:MAG: PAS domain-containing protein [Rhodanobacter sp.]
MATLLREASHEAVICANTRAIAAQIGIRTDAVLLTQEAVAEDMSVPRQALGQQPAWSDVPFVLLVAPPSGRSGRAEASRLAFLELVPNSVVLERPLGRVSLLSTVGSALRLREKQFEMRDRLRELRDSDARFQAIANSIDPMVWTALPDGCHDYFNHRWYEYTGVPVGSTNGEGWNDMVHPRDQARAWER